MKYIAVLVVGLFVGLVAGGLQPRAQVRELEEQLAQTEVRPCEGGTGSNVGEDLALLLGAGQNGPLGDRRPSSVSPDDPRVQEAAEEMARAQEEMNQGIGEEFANGEFAVNQEELDIAYAALELRRSQARASLVESADPNDAQLRAIDDAVDEMNENFAGLVEEFADLVDSGDVPDRRDAMEFASEALLTVLDADERIRSALDEDQIQQLDDAAIDPFSYLDPALLDLLADVGR